jgi:ribosomal subunit interface protein
VDIVVRGRHTEVPERFRQHVEEKLSRIGKLDGKVIRIDVEVCRERNPRQADTAERVELTCTSRGPVIRAEAAASDPYAALDLAYAKLESRLRKAADRRRVHRGSRTPMSVAEATAALTTEPEVATQPVNESEEEFEEGPLVVREKVHKAAPMTLDEALFEMELVGHDFFLFADEKSGLPSVVYRRRGYDYGVIRLDAQ